MDGPDQAPPVPFEPQPATPVLFEAVIVPHRSLSARGRRILLGAIGLACGTSAAVFMWLGAWPVGMFTGAELLLAAALFRMNALAARSSELLLLTDDGLLVVRTSPRGARRTKLLPADWLSVRLQERPGRVPALLLVGRGSSEEVASSLGEDEKRDLAQALAAALHRRRNPLFDNPQLRP